LDKKPLILVTNDDGIYAKGISELVQIAKQFGDVLVVAPDKPQSGMGHAVTINNILRVKKHEIFENVEAYSCTGTPVDCVKLAIYKVFKRKPDLLLSGINHGANHSINVIYSGTMSAAVEGAVEGVPSIGFSLLNHDENADFSHCHAPIKQIIKEALNNGIDKNTCLNVNVPKEHVKGIKVCRQGNAFWEDNFEVREDPMRGEYYWLKGVFTHLDKGQDTDIHALEEGYVSVVPIQFDMTAHHSIAGLNEWNLEQ